MKTFKIFVMLMSIHLMAFSQLNPSGSQYYLNPFLANPAFAGKQPGLEGNIAYKAQWTAIPDAPSLQSFTCTYGTKRKIGLGLTIAREIFGVFNRSSAKLSYAYHLPMDNEGMFLDFGVSGGVKNSSINYKKVIAEAGDQTLLTYNDRPWHADGDVGMVLRNNWLTFGAGVSDLRKFLHGQKEKLNADRPGLLLSLQGRFEKEDMMFHPLLQYRFVRFFRNVWDAGLQGSFAQGNLIGSIVYHSTNSVTFSVGTNYLNRLRLFAFYTSGTSDFSRYSNGEFEFALQYLLR